MSRSKVFAILLVVGLLSLLIPLALALAQGGGDTVTIRDSDDTNFSDKLSDKATIMITGAPPLAADKTYEGWFVSDDGSRKESTGLLTPDANGNINQTFWLSEEATTTTVEEQSITITLDELNASGQSGTATLTASGDMTQVVINVTPAASTADEPQPIHIHLAPCGTDIGGIAADLTNGGTTGVVGGMLTIVVDATLASLMDGNQVINIHKFTAEIGTYTACGNIPVPRTVSTAGGPTGENLFADFDKFVVTIEPADDPDPGPSADVAYIHAIPAGGIVHIRHLLFSWIGNPAYTVGFHMGTPKGIAVGLREQTRAAMFHARLSKNSNTLADVHLHACHVVNIIEGTGDKGGTNFDPTCGNPGDGFGVLNYAADTVLHAGLAASSAPGDAIIAKHGKEAVDSANNVWAWAKEARDQALLVLATNDLEGAKIIIVNVEDRLTKALNGFDADGDSTAERITGEGGAKQSYWAAQDMGMYSLMPPAAPPVDEEPKPPKTGDSSVPNIALGALLLGAFLLLSGGFIYRRSRRRA
jgi:LPXTG-motif cell wall-anchored protein